MKVTMDCGKYSRIFLAEGDSVVYERNTQSISNPPPADSTSVWPKTIITTHTLMWETVEHEGDRQ